MIFRSNFGSLVAMNSGILLKNRLFQPQSQTVELRNAVISKKVKHALVGCIRLTKKQICIINPV